MATKNLTLGNADTTVNLSVNGDLQSNTVTIDNGYIEFDNGGGNYGTLGYNSSNEIYTEGDFKAMGTMKASVMGFNASLASIDHSIWPQQHNTYKLAAISGSGLQLSETINLSYSDCIILLIYRHPYYIGYIFAKDNIYYYIQPGNYSYNSALWTKIGGVPEYTASTETLTLY